MMRIAVVSDTHHRWQAVAEAVRKDGGIDYLIFLGDLAEDGEKLQKALQIPATIVRGNCDSIGSVPEEALITLENVRILACHGHRYGVKNGLDRIIYRGLEQQADVVLFGHTHQAIEMRDDIYLFNPGSASMPKNPHERPSWGLLTIEQTAGQKIFEKKVLKYEKKTCQIKYNLLE